MLAVLFLCSCSRYVHCHGFLCFLPPTVTDDIWFGCVCSGQSSMLLLNSFRRQVSQLRTPRYGGASQGEVARHDPTTFRKLLAHHQAMGSAWLGWQFWMRFVHSKSLGIGCGLPCQVLQLSTLSNDSGWWWRKMKSWWQWWRAWLRRQRRLWQGDVLNF